MALLAVLFAREELDRHIELMTGEKPAQGRFVITARDGDSDGFSIFATNGVVRIEGESPRGALYGVYELLERFGGCGWYAPWRTVIPKRASFDIPDGTAIREQPAFIARMPSWYGVRTNQLFAARCRMNGESPDGSLPHPDPKFGLPPLRFARRLYPSHTFLTLVPPERYFDSHPEYFSEIAFRRVRDSTQLCLSNPEVADVAASNALEFAKADSGCKIIGVSQMDWGGFCECMACRRILDEEGSLAGPLIRFVNAVAERIERERPDLLVETIAYAQTFKPPKHARPRKNVIVCCCTAADHAEPLDASAASKNAEWIKSYQTWTDICTRTFQWDYTPNFRWFFLPHPNIPTYAPNLRFYRRHGVRWVYMDGQPLPGGDFADLRSWLLAKLLWNPDQDTDSLVNRFFDKAYRAAAPFARAVYDLQNQRLAMRPDAVLTYTSDDNRELFPDDTLREAYRLWCLADKATRADASANFAVRIAKYPATVALLHRLEKHMPSFSVATRIDNSSHAAEIASLLADEAEIREAAAARGITLCLALQRGQDRWLRRRFDRMRNRRVLAASLSTIVPAVDFCIRDGDYTGGEWNERHGYHARTVEDSSAYGGRAVEIFARDGLDAMRFFMSDLAFDEGVRLKLRIHAKANGASSTETPGGNAFSVAVKGSGEGFRRDVRPDEVSGEWSWVDIGHFVPRDNQKLDIKGAVSGRAAFQSVFIDAVELSRDAKDETACHSVGKKHRQTERNNHETKD